MTDKTVVTDDMVVTLEYTLRLDSGEIADSSDESDPMFVLQGHGDVIPGLERALYGMAIGESKQVTVAPADGYGDVQDDSLYLVPFEAFPEDLSIEQGMDFVLENEDGDYVQAFVSEITDEGVWLDLNHPLAGQTLHFDIKVIGMRPATDEEIAHGHVHGEFGDDEDDDLFLDDDEFEDEYDDEDVE